MHLFTKSNNCPGFKGSHDPLLDLDHDIVVPLDVCADGVTMEFASIEEELLDGLPLPGDRNVQYRFSVVKLALSNESTSMGMNGSREMVVGLARPPSLIAAVGLAGIGLLNLTHPSATFA